MTLSVAGTLAMPQNNYGGYSPLSSSQVTSPFGFKLPQSAQNGLDAILALMPRLGLKFGDIQSYPQQAQQLREAGALLG